MPTDIVLINAASSHGVYGVLGQTLVAVEPPMWLRVTAGYLRQRKWRVAVIDAEQERLSLSETAERVEQLDPKLVGLLAWGHTPSATTQSMPAAIETATAIKARNPQRKIAIAGGHVSALPEQTLIESPMIDYAIKGEGPLTFAGWLGGLINTTQSVAETTPGLVWRDWGVIHVNDPAPPLDPIRDMHDQGWDFTPPKNYLVHNWQTLGRPEAARTPYASIWTSLNCPHRCNFCNIATPFGGPGYKTRDPAAVVDEIEMLHKEHGVEFYKFIDEMYLLKPSHYLPIAQGLADRGLGDKINCWMYGRVDSVKPDTLNLLRRGGARWIALGIESGDPDIRDGADKRLREDDIVGVVKTIQDNGIHVIGNFMFGFEHDSRATMQATLDLALECLPEWANFYCTMALPGSRLYDQAIAEGWTLPSTWAGYSQHGRHTRPLDTRHVSAAEVLRFRDAAFRTYFTAPNYRAMLLRKFGYQAIEQVDKMLEYRLERDLLKEAS